VVASLAGDVAPSLPPSSGFWSAVPAPPHPGSITPTHPIATAPSTAKTLSDVRPFDPFPSLMARPPPEEKAVARRRRQGDVLSTMAHGSTVLGKKK
jgi:hypothetical protein